MRGCCELWVILFNFKKELAPSCERCQIAFPMCSVFVDLLFFLLPIMAHFILQCLDYSDDEEERKVKRTLRHQKRQLKGFDNAEASENTHEANRFNHDINSEDCFQKTSETNEGKVFKGSASSNYSKVNNRNEWNGARSDASTGDSKVNSSNNSCNMSVSDDSHDWRAHWVTRNSAQCHIRPNYLPAQPPMRPPRPSTQPPMRPPRPSTQPPMRPNYPSTQSPMRPNYPPTQSPMRPNYPPMQPQYPPTQPPMRPHYPSTQPPMRPNYPPPQPHMQPMSGPQFGEQYVLPVGASQNHDSTFGFAPRPLPPPPPGYYYAPIPGYTPPDYCTADSPTQHSSQSLLPLPARFPSASHQHGFISSVTAESSIFSIFFGQQGIWCVTTTTTTVRILILIEVLIRKVLVSVFYNIHVYYLIKFV